MAESDLGIYQRLHRKGRKAGSPPDGYYIQFRRVAKEFFPVICNEDWSIRQKADALGFSVNGLIRVFKLLNDAGGEAAIEVGLETGDWTRLEDGLFGKFGNYRSRPFYKRIQEALNDPDAEPKKASRAGRPKGSKNRKKDPPAAADADDTSDDAGRAADDTDSPSEPAPDPASSTPEAPTTDVPASTAPPTSRVFAAPGDEKAPNPFRVAKRDAAASKQQHLDLVGGGTSP